MRPIVLVASLLTLAACDPAGSLAPTGPRRPAPHPVPLDARRPSGPLDSLIVVLPVEPVVDFPESYGG